MVRGIEFYKGHLIAYSAGNFVGYGGVFGLSGPTAVSYVLHVRLRSDGRFRSAKIIPTLLTGQGIAEHDSSEQAITLVRSLTEADFPASGARIAEKWCDSASDVVICDRRSSWPIQERTSVWFAGTCTSSVRDREVPIWLPEP